MNCKESLCSSLSRSHTCSLTWHLFSPTSAQMLRCRVTHATNNPTATGADPLRSDDRLRPRVRRERMVHSTGRLGEPLFRESQNHKLHKSPYHAYGHYECWSKWPVPHPLIQVENLETDADAGWALEMTTTPIVDDVCSPQTLRFSNHPIGRSLANRSII